MSEQLSESMTLPVPGVAAPSGCSSSISSLATALAKAQGQIANAAKDRSNPAFKSTYADLASVWEACRQPLSANGLSVVHRTEMTQAPGEIIVVTLLLHASGEWMESRMPFATGTWHQTGSALTYARRYALSAMVGVAPGDDDDGNEASAAGQQVTRHGNGDGQWRGNGNGNGDRRPTGRPNGGYASGAQRGSNGNSGSASGQHSGRNTADHTHAGDSRPQMTPEDLRRREEVFRALGECFDRYYPGTSNAERRGRVNMALGFDPASTATLTTEQYEDAIRRITEQAESKVDVRQSQPLEDSAPSTDDRDDSDLGDPFADEGSAEDDASADNSDPFAETPDATPVHHQKPRPVRGEVR